MDFGKIFLHAIKYPLNFQVFPLLFIVNLAFSYATVSLVRQTSAILSSLSGTGLLFIPFAIFMIIIGIVLMTFYVDNAAKYFAGRRKDLRESVQTVKKKFRGLLGTYILMILIISVSAVPLLAFILTGNGLAVTVIGIVIIAVAAFFVVLAPYVVVLDRFSAVDAIKKSIAVVSKNKLNMFIFWIIYLIIIVLVRLASLPVSLNYLPGMLQLDILIVVLQSLISTYTTLFMYSAFTNFYLSVKRR